MSDKETVDHYDASYGNFASDLYSTIRREAFGEDIGQNGWLTAEEQDEFRAVPGTAIQTIPGMPHRIEAVGDKKFRAVAFWWAPGGNPEVLDCKLNLLEGVGTEAQC